MTDRTASMRRLLVRLAKGAQLHRAGGAFLLSGRRGPKAAIPAELVELLVTERLVAETADGIAITADGEHWLAGDASLALEARLVTDEGGREHYVVVNTAESPLSLLRRHGVISATAYDAGEKLRRDYTIGQLTPRMGVDYSAPVGSHAFRPDLTETVVAARQRFNHALRAAGPGLSDVLFDVCCYLMRLEECEQNHNWPRGSARVVLGLALERLAEHYGMTAPSQARTRSWRRED
ncbi:DUF6456 domain-containing protein [Rhizomicrobium electricum]|uniref:DUF6456 domain-containing protein n=1 Tax=Rhizomicrobium electricum TaxID=480070 RepID=A0ABN1EIV8_9PROT|nr:DUF6456 domain-containing protein [Rhizomicrobium electricum]NIJ48372.1 hypothetical protein [Rhizomicrobium electricum]